MPAEQALFEYLLRLGDNCLVLGQRLSAWCGHGPVIEEDLALTNVALDLIGQTRLWLDLAGQREGAGRDADALAFRRDCEAFHNLLLVEQPNGDFAVTMARQFYFDAWHRLLLQELTASSESALADIAAKALKEVSYHLLRSRDWVIRLGDGSDESHARMQRAIDDLWMYSGEMFRMDEVDHALLETGVAVDLRALHEPWLAEITTTLERATLDLPTDSWMQRGGKQGVHSEHLGFLLAEMQFLQRAYPDANW